MWDNNGFTLLELLLALLIGTIVFGTAFTLLLFNTDIFARASGRVDIQYDCTQILDKVTALAKRSAQIDDSRSLEGLYIFIDESGIEFSRITYDGSSKTLTINGDGVVYEEIASFSMTAETGTDGILWNIEITGTRLKAEEAFKTSVKLRNFEH